MAEKFEKNQVLPGGSSEHFNKFTQSCKTYHFIVNQFLKIFLDEQGFMAHTPALAPYTILCSRYIESVSTPSPPPTRLNSSLARR
jgi:hypothetical protein